MVRASTGVPAHLRCAGTALLSRLVTVAAAFGALAGESAVGATSEDPLQFRIAEGQVQNAFYQHGPVAAHLLLSSGHEPRLLFAFPAGNSGVGVWCEKSKRPVNWALGEIRALSNRDAR